jgi:hypothetical protein
MRTLFKTLLYPTTTDKFLPHTYLHFYLILFDVLNKCIKFAGVVLESSSDHVTGSGECRGNDASEEVSL